MMIKYPQKQRNGTNYLDKKMENFIPYLLTQTVTVPKGRWLEDSTLLIILKILKVDKRTPEKTGDA